MSPSGHWVPGERAVRELLDAAPGRVHRLLVDARRPFPDVQAEAERRGVTVEFVDEETLHRRTGGAPARGIAALASPPEWVPLDEMLAGPADAPGRQVVVALDGVEDPQNLGAVIRSCEFFGVRGLVWSKDRSPTVTPAVVRASAGASERLALCMVTNLATALRDCQDAGFWLVGMVADGGEPLGPAIREDRLPSRVVVVLGSEGRGLRRLTRERCDFLVTIERRGAVGSLNVSAAAAVTLSWLVGGELAAR